MVIFCIIVTQIYHNDYLFLRVCWTRGICLGKDLINSVLSIVLTEMSQDLLKK